MGDCLVKIEGSSQGVEPKTLSLKWWWWYRTYACTMLHESTAKCFIAKITMSSVGTANIATRNLDFCGIDLYSLHLRWVFGENHGLESSQGYFARSVQLWFRQISFVYNLPSLWYRYGVQIAIFRQKFCYTNKFDGSKFDKPPLVIFTLENALKTWHPVILMITRIMWPNKLMETFAFCLEKHIQKRTCDYLHIQNIYMSRSLSPFPIYRINCQWNVFLDVTISWIPQFPIHC